MKDLVKVLSRGNNSIDKTTKANLKYAKTIGELNSVIVGMTKNIKKGTSSKEKEIDATNKIGKEADNVKKKFGKLGSSVTGLMDSAEKFDGSVNGATSSLLKFAGITGIAAGAIGIAAGTVETIIQNYIAALQAGFSFNDELVKMRENVGLLGLNMASLTEILGGAGENVRRLGKTSFDSINSFIQLTSEVRDASKDFGFFGLTAGETMQELSTQLGLLRRLGLSDGTLLSTTRDSFMTLNKEVLGYARLTGRQRRDLLREGVIDQNAMVRSLFRDMAPEAVINARAIEAGFAALGDGGELLEMAMARFVADKKGLAYLISSEQYLLEQFFPKIGDAFRNISDVIGDANATPRMRAEVIAELNGAIQSYMGTFSDYMARYSGKPIGDISTMLYKVGEEGAALGSDPNAIYAAMNESLTRSEKNLLNLNNAIAQVQQTFLAQFFKIFGLDNLEKGITQEQLDTVLEKMKIAGDNVQKFIYWIIDVFKSMDAFNQNIVGDDPLKRFGMIVGELFAGKILMAAIGNAVGAAIGAALAIAAAGPISTAIAGIFTATGVGTIVSALVGGIGALFSAPVVIGALAAAAVGYALYDPNVNKKLKEEGYKDVDRYSLIGIDLAAKALDATLNSFNSLVNLILPGTGVFDIAPTDSNLSGMFMNLVAPTTQLEPPPQQSQQSSIWDPSTQRISTDNMIIPDVTSQQSGSIQTGITPENAFRFGERGEQYLKEMRDAIDETNRLMRLQTDAIQYN